jgi:hypothetical protein
MSGVENALTATALARAMPLGKDCSVGINQRQLKATPVLKFQFDLRILLETDRRRQSFECEVTFYPVQPGYRHTTGGHRLETMDGISNRAHRLAAHGKLTNAFAFLNKLHDLDSLIDCYGIGGQRNR